MQKNYLKLQLKRTFIIYPEIFLMLSHDLQRFGVRTGILMTPESCARRGLKAMFRGRRCRVPDWWFILFIPLCRLVAGPVMRWLRGFTMKFQK